MYNVYYIILYITLYYTLYIHIYVCCDGIRIWDVFNDRILPLPIISQCILRKTLSKVRAVVLLLNKTSSVAKGIVYNFTYILSVQPYELRVYTHRRAILLSLSRVYTRSLKLVYSRPETLAKISLLRKAFTLVLRTCTL